MTATGKRPWKPRHTYRSGSPFVKLYDGLALAMIKARLVRQASPYVLLAIHWRVQSDYKRNPQAITLREFCAATGYARSTIQLALSELQQRGIIAVRRRSAKAVGVYEIIHHTRWQGPE